ncbi:hypothetical protein ABH994_002299 [Bradyrhizobium yuanmingense]
MPQRDVIADRDQPRILCEGQDALLERRSPYCIATYPITPPRLISSLPTAARCTWSGPSPMRMKRA